MSRFLRCLLGFSLALLLFILPADAAISHVQSKASANTGGANSSISLTFDSSTTSGNLIVVAVSSWGASQTVSSVTDNKGNTYTKIGSTIYSPGDDMQETWYAKNITGGSSHQITVNVSSPENIGISISEYSGADTTEPLDQVATGTGTSSTSTSGNITPTVDGCLIYSAGVDQRLATTTVTAGSGYTLRTMAGTADDSVRVYAQDRIQATAASISASFSIGTSVHWAIKIISFKPATGGSAVQQRLMMMGIGN